MLYEFNEEVEEEEGPKAEVTTGVPSNDSVDKQGAVGGEWHKQGAVGGEWHKQGAVGGEWHLHAAD